MKKILVLFAHPSQERSEVNIELARAARKLPIVTLVELYAEYPGMFIDAEREQKRLLEHDVLVFQHPFYWYSTPAILKEWQDIVLEYGFAYGKDGDKLKGKTFLSCITAGGPEGAYRAEGYNHFTIRELLTPLEQTANLCQMEFLPPYMLYASRRAKEEGRIAPHVEGWVEMLTALAEDRLERKGLHDLNCLNLAKIRPGQKPEAKAEPESAKEPAGSKRSAVRRIAETLTGKRGGKRSSPSGAGR